MCKGLPVAVKKEAHLYRGQILKVGNGVFTVLLMDHGKQETVSSSDIALLCKELKELNKFCVCIKLIGVKPAGSMKNGQWTNVAIEYLSDIVLRHHLYLKQCVSCP